MSRANITAEAVVLNGSTIANRKTTTRIQYNKLPHGEMGGESLTIVPAIRVEYIVFNSGLQSIQQTPPFFPFKGII